MLDVAVVGGGVCGLVLGRALAREGYDFALFEARPRLGGRVLTVTCSNHGNAVDLGPTWFWPDTQAALTRLIAELGLSHFTQHDEGTLLTLADADKKPEAKASPGLHGGARRLAGGMARLVEALAQSLPAETIRLEQQLVSVEALGTHVRLGFRRGSTIQYVRARRVALAVPPRLLAERVSFTPVLEPGLAEAMAHTPTWMAAQAKAVLTYDRASWRDKGYSGDAFVTHEQAVLGETFDACEDGKAALGGFLALPPDLRDSFATGLPLLIGNQVGQIFGPEVEDGTQHYQDWAREDFTCSALDRAAPAPHLDFGPQILREPQWNGRLFFGSAETASHANGYLEGAVGAAQRIKRDIDLAGALEARARQGERLFAPPAEDNAASLETFRNWASGQAEAAFARYRQRLNRALAQQQREQLTQRAVLGAVEESYGDALAELERLSFDSRGLPVERGCSALTPQVQTAFRDFLPALLDKVVDFNRTSCALSNFPREHHISGEYQQTILRDIAAAWREFSLSANRILLAKGHSAKDHNESPALP